MIKLVAFDWNGTLFADAQTILNADNIVFKKLGMKPVSIKKFRESFHMPVVNYWKNLGYNDRFINKNKIIIEELFAVIYEPLANKTRSRAGAREVLKFLNSQKIEAIIYSNHTTPNIENQLRRLKLDKLIAKVLARDIGDYSHVHKRGKQQKLEDYVKQRKFKPREIISIGDTEEEIEIGKELGYHTVAITGGYNTTARLKKHHPDFLIHNMLELKKIAAKLNNN
jgi:phosphoglycolate phosphatase-like HAD superfamily hydrolase